MFTPRHPLALRNGVLPELFSSKTSKNIRRTTRLTLNCRKHTFTMGQEDAVYLAKLAEQAERYEGK
jgi:hypothetical protein